MGPLVAQALSYDTWQGKISLEDHARGITGFTSMPPNKCFNVSFAATGKTGKKSDPACETKWTSKCRPVPSPPPPPPPPCTNQCMKWTSAARSATPYDLTTPACDKQLTYFRTKLVPDIQLAVGRAAGRQFARDAQNWTVSTCRYSSEDYFSQGFSVWRTEVQLCGPVSAGRNVGAAVAKALSAAVWRGTNPLATHASFMTGYAGSGCLNTTLAVSGSGNPACGATVKQSCDA
ncbi:hypothetical protein HYH03_001876 [Edaphochlamys debaryana]|uniref:Uncharacterized protein n=1 Tax=Edaphochlamys debaryana TaxID=47281 RepID=A0A835YCR1_9CHLO|nr:hypothetical protein HYH03_001876 [Edaphochlamys debaryana]|eukprot:KAG2500298.1 hypothetical protein HYH03_001876 [Edaphochlamys debaryana]